MNFLFLKIKKKTVFTLRSLATFIKFLVLFMVQEKHKHSTDAKYEKIGNCRETLQLSPLTMAHDDNILFIVSRSSVRHPPFSVSVREIIKLTSSSISSLPSCICVSPGGDTHHNKPYQCLIHDNEIRFSFIYPMICGTLPDPEHWLPFQGMFRNVLIPGMMSLVVK